MTRSQACRILGVSIDADMQEIKKKLAETMKTFRLPRYHELPDVGLYLEQVVRYVNRYIIMEENELTPSMVSNYVKQKLIPGPVKKSYTADSIAYLLFMASTKTVIPLGDIRFMMGVQKETYDLQVDYYYFCAEFENLIQYVYGLKEKEDEIGYDDTEQKELLRSALLSVTYKIYLEQYVKFLRERTD